MARAAKKKKTPKSKKARRPKVSAASRADPLELYERSVQAPEVDVEFFQRLYQERFKGVAHTLREDFCGSAALCRAWVASQAKRQAWGVDLDVPTLSWAQERARATLKAEAVERMSLIEGDVRTTSSPPVDVLCAQNFSYCVFKTRAELKAYFERCYAALESRGVFVVDLFGGYESMEDDREEVTDHDDFDYVWEQHRYDPINAFGIYKIHFRFPDESEIADAFVYDWRLWTLPEVRELMEEVGFDSVDVYWEDEDPKTGEGLGTYSRQTTGDCDPAWNAYVVGARADRS